MVEVYPIKPARSSIEADRDRWWSRMASGQFDLARARRRFADVRSAEYGLLRKNADNEGADANDSCTDRGRGC